MSIENEITKTESAVVNEIEKIEAQSSLKSTN